MRKKEETRLLISSNIIQVSEKKKLGARARARISSFSRQCLTYELIKSFTQTLDHILACLRVELSRRVDRIEQQHSVLKELSINECKRVTYPRTRIERTFMVIRRHMAKERERERAREREKERE